MTDVSVAKVYNVGNFTIGPMLITKAKPKGQLKQILVPILAHDQKKAPVHESEHNNVRRIFDRISFRTGLSEMVYQRTIINITEHPYCLFRLHTKKQKSVIYPYTLCTCLTSDSKFKSNLDNKTVTQRFHNLTNCRGV